jgi:hypothetical protein
MCLTVRSGGREPPNYTLVPGINCISVRRKHESLRLFRKLSIPLRLEMGRALESSSALALPIPYKLTSFALRHAVTCNAPARTPPRHALV